MTTITFLNNHINDQFYGHNNGYNKGVFVVPVNPTRQQKAIGERLMQLRKKRGITQKEMAQQLKVTQSMISDYENGAFRLHGDLIIRIAKILKVSADTLLGLERGKESKASKKDDEELIKNRRIYKRIRNINKLPKRDQDALLRTIDAFLAKG